MITTLDTNILIGLLEGEPPLSDRLAQILDHLAEHGDVLIAPVVYAELLAAPSRPPALIDALLSQTSVRVDWLLEQSVWRAAGMACRPHSGHRHFEGAKTTERRRILADFIIGAHAVQRHATLLTWDAAIYRRYFPNLETVEP